jgi:hypothetical protein
MLGPDDGMIGTNGSGEPDNSLVGTVVTVGVLSGAKTRESVTAMVTATVTTPTIEPTALALELALALAPSPPEPIPGVTAAGKL